MGEGKTKVSSQGLQQIILETSLRSRSVYMWKLWAQKFPFLVTVFCPLTLSLPFSKSLVSTGPLGSPFPIPQQTLFPLPYQTSFVFYCQSLAWWPYQHPQCPLLWSLPLSTWINPNLCFSLPDSSHSVGENLAIVSKKKIANWFYSISVELWMKGGSLLPSLGSSILPLHYLPYLLPSII